MKIASANAYGFKGPVLKSRKPIISPKAVNYTVSTKVPQAYSKLVQSPSNINTSQPSRQPRTPNAVARATLAKSTPVEAEIKATTPVDVQRKTLTTTEAAAT